MYYFNTFKLAFSQSQLKSSLDTFISLIEKRGLEKHSIKGVYTMTL